MRITVAWLTRHGACKRNLKRFKRLFPRGCKLNERNYFKWVHGLGAWYDGSYGSVLWAMGLCASNEFWLRCRRRWLDLFARDMLSAPSWSLYLLRRFLALEAKRTARKKK